MLLKDLRVNASIELNFRRGETKFSMPSKISDINGKEIHALISDEEILLFKFQENSIIYVLTTVEGKVLRWFCECKGVKQDGNLKCLILTSEQEGEAYNRRNAYRVELMQETQFRSPDGDLCDALIRDVSATGIGFNAWKWLQIGDTFNMKFPINGVEITITAKIVRCVNFREGKYRFIYGATLTGKQDTKLEKLLIEKQREEIKRARMLK